MKNSNVIDYLQKFDKTMLSRWRNFIESPYFNKHQQTISLAKQLCLLFPFEQEKAIKKEQLFQMVYNNQPYDDDKMRWLIHNLLKLTEEFIYQEKVVLPKLQSKSLELLPVLKEEFDFVRHAYHTKRAKKQINEFINYEKQYQLYNEIDDANIHQNKFTATENLINKNEYQKKWLLYEALKNACDLTNRAQFVKFDFSHTIGNWAINELEQNYTKYKNEPALLIYYCIYNSIVNVEDLKNYKLLKSLVFKHQHQFKKAEQRNLFYYLLNFSLRKINKGETSFLKTAFEIFEQMLKEELLYIGEHLPENVFKNIIAIALRLDKTKWVKEFIEQYAKELPSELAANAFQFNMANYYYQIGDMQSAMQQLINVEYTNLNYNLDSKALLLRIYFDLNEDEAFDAHFNAFKVYLIRNKLLANKKHRRYYNLFRFTNRLYNLKNKAKYQKADKTKTQLDSLKKQMERAGSIANLSWLNERLASLR